MFAWIGYKGNWNTEGEVGKTNALRMDKIDKVHDDYLNDIIDRATAKTRLLNLGVSHEDIENNLGLIDSMVDEPEIPWDEKIVPGVGT